VKTKGNAVFEGRFWIALVLMFGIMIGVAQAVSPSLQAMLDAASSRGEPVRVRFATDGAVLFLGAPPDAGFNPGLSSTTPEELAYRFLKKEAESFGIQSNSVDFDVERVTRGPGGTYVRLQQTYDGIPVFGAQVLVQVSTDGKLSCVFSDILRNTRSFDAGKLGTTPVIDARTAIDTAKAALAAAYGTDALSLTERPGLVLFSPSVLSISGSDCLAWSLVLASDDLRPVKEQILIDAATGAVAWR